MKPLSKRLPTATWPTEKRQTASNVLKARQKCLQCPFKGIQACRKYTFVHGTKKWHFWHNYLDTALSCASLTLSCAAEKFTKLLSNSPSSRQAVFSSSSRLTCVIIDGEWSIRSVTQGQGRYCCLVRGVKAKRGGKKTIIYILPLPVCKRAYLA